MIKDIYLHIGLHKTGSSSIQVSLSKSRVALKKYGYLYPVFKKGQENIHNHSIPFYSLFTNNPLKYHINIAGGSNTLNKVEQLHKEYIEQFKNQINTFGGENLIISGEDISRLSAAQLQNLNFFLLEQVGQQAKIHVIVFVRNPLYAIQSRIQEGVKHGKTLIETNSTVTLEHKHFKRIFSQLFEVFSKNEVMIVQFENAIKHPNGLVGDFLTTISAPTHLNNEIKYTHANKSISHEALVIQSAINNILPKFIDGENNPLLIGFVRRLIFEIPGEKIILSNDIYQKIWELAQPDIEWLNQNFHIQYTQPIKKTIPNSILWSQDSLEYITRILRLQPSVVCEIICNKIYLELFRHYKKMSYSQIAGLIQFLNKHEKWIKHTYQLPRSSCTRFKPHRYLSIIGINTHQSNITLFTSDKKLRIALEKIHANHDKNTLDSIQLYDGLWGY